MCIFVQSADIVHTTDKFYADAEDASSASTLFFDSSFLANPGILTSRQVRLPGSRLRWLQEWNIPDIGPAVWMQLQRSRQFADSGRFAFTRLR